MCVYVCEKSAYTYMRGRLSVCIYLCACIHCLSAYRVVNICDNMFMNLHLIGFIFRAKQNYPHTANDQKQLRSESILGHCILHTSTPLFKR